MAVNADRRTRYLIELGGLPDLRILLGYMFATAAIVKHWLWGGAQHCGILVSLNACHGRVRSLKFSLGLRSFDEALKVIILGGTL